MLNLKLDHLGIIVKSIEREMKIYEKLGYVKVGELFQDDNQQMRGQFLKLSNQPDGGGGLIELIEDLSESKSLSRMLNSQCGRIYHLAFQVENLEEQIGDILAQSDARILSAIKTAQYYSKVCFLFLPNAQIIELVEYR